MLTWWFGISVMYCLFFKSPQHNIELWHSHQGNRGCFNKCRIALFQIMLACTGSSRRKKERARKRRGSLSPSCVHVLSCTHYFQEQAMIMQVRDSLETKKLCCYHKFGQPMKIANILQPHHWFWKNSPKNGILGMSAEISYWWQVTTQIWIVLLIGCAAWQICYNQSEGLPISGW